MEEVKENTRASIANGINRNTVLNRPAIQPTVGAGGQYSVETQAQPEGGFTKLARSLSAFNTTLGALGERGAAASELAPQKQSELTLEEIAEISNRAKEDEDKLYAENGFIDSLTRKGGISNMENPLTFSRAQRAAGVRVGSDDYRPMLAQRIQKARELYKNNRVEYDINQIIESTQAELGEKYGMQEGSSIQRGFSDIAYKANSEARIRDFEMKSKIDSVFAEGDMGMSIYSAISGSKTDQEVLESLKNISSKFNNVGLDGSQRSFAASLSKLADEDTDAANRFNNLVREGGLKGIKFGGVDISTPSFERVMDSFEDELYKVEKRREAEISEDNANINRDIKKLVDSSLRLPDDQRTAATLGIELPNYEPDQMIPRDEIVNAIENKYLSEYPAMANEIRSTALQSQRTLDQTKAVERNNFERRISRVTGKVENDAGSKNSQVMGSYKYHGGKVANDQNLTQNMAEVYAEYKGNIRNAKANIIDGEPPENVDPIMVDGEPKPISEYSDKELSKLYNDSLTKYAESATDKFFEIDNKLTTRAEKVSIDDANKATKDSIENSVSTKYEQMELPNKVLSEIGATEADMFQNTKSSLGLKEAVNWKIQYEPNSNRLNRIKKSKKIIDDGGYYREMKWQNQAYSGYISSQFGDEKVMEFVPLSEKILKNLERSSDEDDKYTPYKLEDLKEFKEKQSFYTRGTTFNPSDLNNLYYEGDSDEEINQIIDAVKEISGDKTYSRSKLESKKPKLIKIEE